MSAFSDAVIALAPYVYLRLGESVGTTAADASGNSRNFTYQGAGITYARTSSLSGDADTAVRIQSSYARSAFQLNTAPASIHLRVRLNGSVPTTALVCGFANGAGAAAYDKIIYLDAVGKFAFRVFDGSTRIITAPSAASANTWYSIVATIGAAGMKLYINSVLVASNGAVTSSYTGYSTTNVFLGGTTSDHAAVGDMDCDEFAVWNIQIADADVTSLHGIATAPTGPAAPTDLAVDSVTSSSVNLSWTDNAADETGFELQYDVDNAFPSPVTLTLDTADIETATVLSFAASTLYYARVRAVNGAGNSAWSNTVSFTTDGIPELTITGTASGGTYDFGRATSHDFTLQNSGDSALTIGSLNLTGAGFSLAAPPGDPFAVLQPSEQVSLTVNRASSATSGQLTIESDDPDSPYIINLTGTASSSGSSSGSRANRKEVRVIQGLRLAVATDATELQYLELAFTDQLPLTNKNAVIGGMPIALYDAGHGRYALGVHLLDEESDASGISEFRTTFLSMRMGLSRLSISPLYIFSAVDGSASSDKAATSHEMMFGHKLAKDSGHRLICAESAGSYEDTGSLSLGGMPILIVRKRGRWHIAMLAV